jgi:hypothetical protein
MPEAIPLASLAESFTYGRLPIMQLRRRKLMSTWIWTRFAFAADGATESGALAKARPDLDDY